MFTQSWSDKKLWSDITKNVEIYSQKIFIHPYCKKENKNKLSDIMSDHSLDFVQGHEQILAYVDERLLFTAVITRIVNWLALIKFLEPTSLHL